MILSNIFIQLLFNYYEITFNLDLKFFKKSLNRHKVIYLLFIKSLFFTIIIVSN